MLLAAGFTNEEVSKSFGTWNKDDLESPLLEAACNVLKRKDQDIEGCEPSTVNVAPVNVVSSTIIGSVTTGSA